MNEHPHYRPLRVLQFGEGNFLRAFADWMIAVANAAGVLDTDVAVVAPRFGDSRAIAALQQQKGIYHVILEGLQQCKPTRQIQLIDCVRPLTSSLKDPQAYADVILSPQLRIVISNTTEAGICYVPDTFPFSANTFPLKVLDLLYRRFRHFDGDPTKGLIFLCCELIEDNGSRLCDIVLRYARQASYGEDFERWVRTACIFANTLVDRIVSGYPRDNEAEIKELVGADDAIMVKGELYHLWVIDSDRYEQIQREFPLQKAGLNELFGSGIIGHYRRRKVRLLNATHTAMVPLGLAYGCQTVEEAVCHPRLGAFLRQMVLKESIPSLQGSVTELQAYYSGIEQRFLSPYIHHQLRSIALNSLAKWEARNWPIVRDFRLSKGRFPLGQLISFAALMRLYSPKAPYTPSDDSTAKAKLAELWRHFEGEALVRQICAGGVFSVDFEAETPGFASAVAPYLEMPVEEAVEEYLTGQ